MTTNLVQLKIGALQILFRDATDFPNSGAGPPTTAGNNLIIGSPTEVQWDGTGVAASGGARESAKFTFGTPWAQAWSFDACLEFETAPADGGFVEFYLGQSPNATAATGNPGGLTGSDAAFTDTVGNLGQMRHIGDFSLRNNVINKGFVGIITPYYPNNILLIVNNGSTALRSTATAMDETHIVATPVETQIQAGV